MRLGGIAAKNSAIGRYAANALRKSVNPPPPPLEYLQKFIPIII